MSDPMEVSSPSSTPTEASSASSSASSKTVEFCSIDDIVEFGRALTNVPGTSPEQRAHAKVKIVDFASTYLACHGVPLPTRPKPDDESKKKPASSAASLEDRCDYLMELALGNSRESRNSYLAMIQSMIGSDPSLVNDPRIFCIPLIFVTARAFYRTNRDNLPGPMSQYVALTVDDLGEADGDGDAEAFANFMEEFTSSPGSFFSIGTQLAENIRSAMIRTLPIDLMPMIDPKKASPAISKTIAAVVGLLWRMYRLPSSFLPVFVDELMQQCRLFRSLDSWAEHTRKHIDRSKDRFVYEDEGVFQDIRGFLDTFIRDSKRFLGFVSSMEMLVLHTRRTQTPYAFISAADRTLAAFATKENSWDNARTERRFLEALGECSEPWDELVAAAAANNHVLRTGDPKIIIGAACIAAQRRFMARTMHTIQNARTFSGDAASKQERHMWARSLMMITTSANIFDIAGVVTAMLEQKGLAKFKKFVGEAVVADFFAKIKACFTKESDAAQALAARDVNAVRNHMISTRCCASPDLAQTVDTFWKHLKKRLQRVDGLYRAEACNANTKAGGKLSKLFAQLSDTHEISVDNADPAFDILVLAFMALHMRSITMAHADPTKIDEINQTVERFWQEQQAAGNTFIPKPKVESLDDYHIYSKVIMADDNLFLMSIFFGQYACRIYDILMHLEFSRVSMLVLGMPLPLGLSTELMSAPDATSSPKSADERQLKILEDYDLPETTHLATRLQMMSPLLMGAEECVRLIDNLRYTPPVKKPKPPKIDKRSGLLWLKVIPASIAPIQERLIAALTQFHIVYQA